MARPKAEFTPAGTSEHDEVPTAAATTAGAVPLLSGFGGPAGYGAPERVTGGLIVLSYTARVPR